MRICLDVSPAIRRRAGIGRYARELAAALVALGGEHEYTVFCNRPQEGTFEPPLDRLPRLSVDLPDRPWRLRVLLAQLTHLRQDRLLPGIDLFHATDHLLPRLAGVRSVFTLHDLAFRFCPETHTPLNRWFLTLAMPHFLRQADAVIAVSQSTRNDAVRLYGLDTARCIVIPEGVDARFHPVGPEAIQAVCREYHLPERFILFVGTVEPRKNLTALLEAYQALRAGGAGQRLVIVGQRGWREEPIFRRLGELGLEGDVLFPGYVHDADLRAVYAAADLFVFPSLYEGFGLPVLEAMACGVPVVCSAASSLPEVAGDAALLVPPRDTSGLAEAMRRVLGDAALQARLRAQGLERAQRFSWQRAALETARIYSALPVGGCAT